MNILTTVLERDADGTLHLPVPEDLLQVGKVRVVAVLFEEAPPSEQHIAATTRPVEFALPNWFFRRRSSGIEAAGDQPNRVLDPDPIVNLLRRAKS